MKKGTKQVPDLFPDPELQDEDDPDYKLELFETAKACGNKPEDFRADPKFGAEYAEWLKTQ
jgi:hypothetical protein